MEKVNDFRNAVLICDGDASASWNHPKKIEVMNLELSVVGKEQREAFERRLLPRLPDLLRCQAMNMAEAGLRFN